MEEYKRKLIILECIVLLLVGGISYILINGSKELEKPKEENKEMLAMYLEDESGAFRISNGKTFPKECYILERAECKNGGTVTQNPDTKSISASFSKADKCNLYFRRDTELITLSNGLKANPICVSEYSKGEQSEMYTFEHDEATQTTGWTQEERRDYRYIGANPNNWLKFNGEDWRIIGVFTVETASGTKEQLIKIIRNESIGDIAWNSNNVNEWPSSSLKTLLNEGDYYNRVNTYASTGLNSTAQSQIAEVKWYLGASNTYSGLGGPDYYSFERGTKVYSGRSPNTTGKVGLMYPSDYIYTYANGVDSTCYTAGNYCHEGTPANGWLYKGINQWTISPTAAGSMGAFYVYSTGYMRSNKYVWDAEAIHPVVYLSSDIKIVNGNGASSETAYILG